MPGMQVQLQGLGKTYDGHAWAVRGVNLEIPQGSLFGFIGPNGAGKSTTLRMMATSMAPTEGSLLLDGRCSSEDDYAARRRIGFLGDGNPLYKNLTPVEYLRFFGQCYKMEKSELEHSIAQTIETFDLKAKQDCPCGELSKGMRQRVLIARCVLHNPSLLILDEPADGLDPLGRSELRKILHRIQSQGVTIVISSHILRELDDLCDQVAIIQKGSLVVSGEVAQIVERYEVSRNVYEVCALDDLSTSSKIFEKHQALIEESGFFDGKYFVRIQVRGGEEKMAAILGEVVTQGIRVVTVGRERSRLEDVYGRISENKVN